MSTNTPNFGIVLPEGTDTFNPLTFNNTAFTRVDEIMKNNQDRGVTPATHIYLDGVNTISRNIATCNLMVFTATSDYEKGSVIAVDGVTCTFRYADGTAPENNAFRTNQSVICYLNGTILTMVSAGSGEAIIGKLSELTTENKDTIVSAVNEIYSDLSEKEKKPTKESNCIKFDSGLMIVWGELGYKGGTAKTWDKRTVTLSTPFVNNNYKVTATVGCELNNQASYDNSDVMIAERKSDNFTLAVRFSDKGYYTGVDYQAIGFWK